MTKEELSERRNRLLRGTELHVAISRMIKIKGMPAACQSVTGIMGRDGRSEIVVDLTVSVSGDARSAHVYLYLPEDIFDELGFEYADIQIGPKSKEVDIDTLIKLRALRAIFDVIKNISNKYISALRYDQPIYVRTNEDGTRYYDN